MVGGMLSILNLIGAIDLMKLKGGSRKRNSKK